MNNDFKYFIHVSCVLKQEVEKSDSPLQTAAGFRQNIEIKLKNYRQ